MSFEALSVFSSEALILVLVLSFPIVAAAAMTSLLLSVLQALTQIQDQTTPLAIKIMVCFGLLLLLGDWMAGQLLRYADQIFDRITSL